MDRERAAYLPEASAALDTVTFALMLAGGAWFTIGAFVYLTRWPDPWPATFGFHEVFHAMIILGCTCHFVAIERLAS